MYPEGTVVAGKYRLEHVLGEGGMGVVMAARHLDLGSRIALKFLQPEMAKHASVVERFMREARAQAQLQSENVCRVIDVGRVDETGIPYIVMEMLQGQDLARILRAHGPLAPAIVAEYLLQATSALAEAHAAGIVHRDLKPGNLFVVQRPTGKPLVKVLDFGVAKSQGQQQDFSLTRTHNVMGSPGYMSPEQLKSSKVVDARADIWSLGVVMYELLSGRQPFLAESITELAVRVVTEPHPPLPAHLPRGLVDVIGRCLEKDPARRYPDVAALAAALAPFAVGGADSAAGVSNVLRASTASHTPISSPASTATSVPTTLGTASGVSEGSAPRRGRGVLAGVIGAAVAAGIIAVVMLTRGGGEPASTNTPATSVTPAAVPRVDDTTPSPSPPAAPTEAPKPPPADEAPPTAPPPAAETKPAAPPPPDETKPAPPVEPAKPATAAPVETKPAAAAKPAAKPVVVEKKPVTKPVRKKPSVEDLSEMRK